MHPPFYVVDHRVVPDAPHGGRRIVRRNRPEVLTFVPGTPVGG